MKKIIFAFTALMATSAFATDGRSTGCFDIAASVPKSFQDSGPTDAALLKTNAVVCVTENNMKSDDPDNIVSTGEITIRITEGKKQVASYSMGASSSEGAAGTFYTSYGKTRADVENLSDDTKYKVITFAMRNDHLKKGDYAGRLEINGNTLLLTER